MPATSHTHTKTARPNSGAASPQQPGSAAGPQAARPPAPRVPAAAPGSRGLFPGPARTRRASFRSARPALGLNRSFSRPCARFAVSCSFRVSPFLPFCLLLPSCFPPPFTRFVRSPLASSFPVRSFVTFPSAQLADRLSLPPSPLSSDTLFHFLFPRFGCLRPSVFCPRISLLTFPPWPGPRAAPSAPALSAVCAAPAPEPARPAGTRPAGWVLPDAARPARLGTCPRRCGRRCATAASGWDQRSQANCFSLRPNCGFYQESLFQRAQTRSSAASLISSADPHTPPALLCTFPPPAGRRPELPVHSAEAREAPGGRRRVGPISEEPAPGLSCGMWQRRCGGRGPHVSYRSTRAVGAGGLRAGLPGPGVRARSREVMRSKWP